MDNNSDAWTASIKPINITTFFRSLPGRVPPGSAEGERAEARARIGFFAAELNALMLGREHDVRVPADIEALSAMIADRAERYTSEDWSTVVDGRSKLEHARGAVAAISAELRGVAPDEWDEESWETGGGDEEE